VTSSPNSTLQIGLVGAGMVGQLHAQAIAHVPGLKIVGLADLRPELRGQVAARYGIARTFSSHTELLADPQIDAVVVVVRRNATSAVVRDCLLAGKHVLSEKPMAMTAATAAELVDIARQRQLHYVVGFQKRHDTGTERCVEALNRLLSTGELGRLTLVRSWNHTGKDREPDAGLLMTNEERPVGLKLDRQMPDWLPSSYGVSYDRFVNTYCHDMNALHHFFAEDPEVRAAELDILGGQAVILTGKDFVVSMALTLSELTDWQQRGDWDEGLEFHFEGGRLYLQFPPPLYRTRVAKVLLYRGSEPVQVISDGASTLSAFSLQARNFLEDLKARRPSRAAGAACLRDMDLIERVWRVALGDRLGHEQQPQSAAG
jgi:predicted dehydrogenase